MSCLTSAIEPLRAANEISGIDAFAWQIISEDGARVDSSAKVGIDPDLALGGAIRFDGVFLLSGPTANFASPKQSNGHLRRMVRHGVCIGSVSGGVFPLARSGLLDRISCSVHWCYEAAFAAEFPSLKMSDDVIVVDRGCYTVSGAAAVFDLMLHFIKEKLGSEVSTEVACWFQHPMVRGQGVRQTVPNFRSKSTEDTLPKQISQAVQLFSEHMEDRISIADVADAVGLSARQLERNFKTATGQSPSHYYRMLRMRAARQMVMYTKDSISEIANYVGYATSTPMVSHYSDIFGITPKEEREKINMFRVEDNLSIPSATGHAVAVEK